LFIIRQGTYTFLDITIAAKNSGAQVQKYFIFSTEKHRMSSYCSCYYFWL